MAEAKKGYSIWSLLVIMTLLAVWLAIPRRCENGSDYLGVLFFTLHQISGWILVSRLIWEGTGKQILVFSILAAALVVAWLPIVCVLFIEPFATTEYVAVPLSAVGLLEAYESFYMFIARTFGYELIP